jgi:hypothetical protein
MTNIMAMLKRFWGAAVLLGILCICLFSSSAGAVDYRWSFATGTGGTSIAAIKNREGSIFSISCATAGNRRIEIELGSPLITAGKTDLQVVISDDSFQFEITGADGYGRAELVGRIKLRQLISLVDALKKTKEQQFIIELPVSQKELSFSTLEAKKWLTGLLEGCLDNPIAPIQAAASFVGNWYVENPKACKDKPGESAELITYTPDRTMGPEISCTILRATPRGAATELDLLYNGEGERGFRQKELVQVINGHLEVSYVANGRKSTDKYLRCP